MLDGLGLPRMKVSTAPRAPRAYIRDAPRQTGRMIARGTIRSAAVNTLPARVIPIVVAPCDPAHFVAAPIALDPPDQNTLWADPNIARSARPPARPIAPVNLLATRATAPSRLGSRASGALSRIVRPNVIVRAHTEKLWTYEKVARRTLGADGAKSWHLFESYAGKTNAVIHRVRLGREIVHQHVTHIGTYGTRRSFPDVWTGIRTIGRD